VQIRSLRRMGRLLSERADRRAPAAIALRRALFTAMATTIGVGNIVDPIISIGFGGLGALLCCVLAGFFGATRRGF
jgi:Na+/alanine symporter